MTILSLIRAKFSLFFPLALLTLSLFTFSHCSKDSDDDDNVSSSTGPALGAIYLWITGCTVIGDMSSGTGSDECGGIGSGTGTARADSICQARYDDDVDPDDRTRITGELDDSGAASPQHKALLAADGALPQSFEIRGKDTLTLKRPDGSTTVANSYADLFDPEVDLLAPFSSDNLSYFTGLTTMEDEFILGDNCTNWSAPSGAGAASSGETQSYMGGEFIPNRERWFNSTSLNCDNGRIVCITH